MKADRRKTTMISHDDRIRRLPDRHRHESVETVASIKLISYKDLAALGIDYTREHLLWLEKRNRFPARVRLSSSRVAWKYDEIADWLRQKASNRA